MGIQVQPWIKSPGQPRLVVGQSLLSVRLPNGQPRFWGILQTLLNVLQV